MINKCIIVALIGLLGILIGKYVSNKLVIKNKYSKDLLAFCDYFKNEMFFKQTKLFKVIADYKFTSEELKKDFADFLSSKVDGQPITIGKIFEENVRTKYNEFFNSLGRFDINTQSEVLDKQRQVLQDIAINFENKVKKEGSLYVKLGFLFGICLGVLVI